MKKLYSFLILNSAFCICFAQWVQLGTNQGSTSSGIISVALQPPSNTPYIAYADAAAFNYVVKSYNGSSWTQVGTSQGVLPPVAGIDLAFHPSANEPYIAYLDSFTNAYTVKKYSASTWTQVGGNIGYALGGIPSIAFHPATSELYIGYPDGAANAFQVERFNGSSWVPVGTFMGTGSGWSGVSLAFNPSTNEPYLAYPDGGLFAFVVRRYTGGSWVQVGGNIGFTGGATPALAFKNSTAEPHIAYADASNNVFVVEKYSGASWSQVGANIGQAASDAGVAMDFLQFFDTPYVLYAENSTNTFTVKVYSGSSWGTVGTLGGAAANAAWGALAINQALPGEIFAAYPDDIANAFVVKRYSLSLGEEESGGEASLSVFPNPSSGHLTLTLSKGEGIVEIYNVMGERILASPIGGGLEGVFDLSTRPKGLYFLKISDETGTVKTGKVVVE